MKILDAESTREVDREAMEAFGIPSLVLMENAAIGLADAIAENFPDAGSAAIFCGPGNNGGDGLALGRHLAIRGYYVELNLVLGGREATGDAAVQLSICRSQGLAIREIGPEDRCRSVVEGARDLDLVVDALFGVGLSRPLEGQYAEIVNALNGLRIPRVAVDLPSGLNGSRAELPGVHLEADLTVTFGAAKVAHVFPPAADAAGQVVVADLGIPPELIERAAGKLYLMAADELAGELHPRSADSHKGDYGHVLLVAGTTGKAGAAILAARSAVRAGAGLITAAVPESVVQTVDLGSVESMTYPLAQGPTGGLADSTAAAIRELSAGKSVLAVGPGLGQERSTVVAIRAMVLETDLPVIVDADGLNAMAGVIGRLRDRSAETILTPHPGELGRLLGVTASEVQVDRPAAARAAAERSGAVVVLKGHQSLVVSPTGDVFVNPTGNPGMASGGTGDVLTGLIAGLVSQGHAALSAAQLGTYLHGAAGDLAADRVGEASLSASDLLESYPEALRALEGCH